MFLQLIIHYSEGHQQNIKMLQLVAVLFLAGAALGAPSIPLESPYILPFSDGKLLTNLGTMPSLELPLSLSPIAVVPESFKALTNIVVPNPPDHRPVMIRVDGEPAPIIESIKVEEPKIEEVKELEKDEVKVEEKAELKLEEKAEPEEKKVELKVVPKVVSYIPVRLTPYHPMYRGWLSDFQGTLQGTFQGLQDKWQEYINHYLPALTNPPALTTPPVGPARYYIY